MNNSLLLLDSVHPVLGFPAATPSSASPKWLDLTQVEAVGILLTVVNAATAVTGSAVTINQAKDNSGTNSKAVAFTDYYSISDASTSGKDAPWTRNTAASNTFTTLTTTSKNAFYFIPLDPAVTDDTNSFNHIQVGLANAVNTTIEAQYWVRPKFAGNPTLIPSFTN